ncbi:MAG: hypothetical protein EHM42_14380 [Planctomycetaceae bacterium]|nr:MAG: hypothetical protein EHM42_14380 [Planctomycetaceae bacterium]
MGTSRKITETQLEKAKSALTVRVEALKAKGVEGKKFKRDPKWRELDSKVRQINARLAKVGEIEVQNEELLRHKEERQAQLAAKKAEKKAGVKKDKVKDDKKPKAKAKTDGKAKPDAKGGGAKKDKTPKK